MAQLTTELRLYDAPTKSEAGGVTTTYLGGFRQPLPDRYVAGWSFELLERGGCGSFTLDLVADLDESEISLPAVEWRLDILLGGTVVYRGWVETVRPAIQDGEPVYRVEGVGRLGRCAGLLVDAAYTKPYGADVSEVFAWIATTFLTGTGRLGEFAQSIESDIGFTIEHAAFFGSNVREAFDRLASASENLVMWGFDVTPDGNDRLWVKRRPLTVTNEDYRFRIGKDVGYLEQPQDTTGLVNAIRLVAGKAKAPNLVFNPSFELPRNPGSGPEGNLLTGSSFESLGDWTLSSGAARQASGGEPGEYARTGEWFLELDSDGGGPHDKAVQTVDLASVGAPLAEDNGFLLTLWHAKQEPTGGDAVVSVLLEQLDAGGSVVGTDLIDEDITATSRSYQEFRRRVLTNHADTAKLRLTLQYVSGTDALIDDVFLFEADELIQEGWQRENRGSGSGDFDWANQGPEGVPPFHGAYCVAVVTTGCDASGNADNVRLYPARGNWASVRDKTSHIVKVRVWGAAGLKLRIGLERRGGEGGRDLKFGSEETLAGTGDWETLTTTVSSTNHAEIRPLIELRSNGTYYLDAVEVYENGVEDRGDALFFDGERMVFELDTEMYASQVVDGLAGATGATMHPTDPLQVDVGSWSPTVSDLGKTLRITSGTGWTAGDYRIISYDGSQYLTLDKSPAAAGETNKANFILSYLPGLSSANTVRFSQAHYGRREAVLDVDTIEDEQAARLYATGYLNRHATPRKQGRLTLNACETAVLYVDPSDPDAPALGMVAVSGAETAIADQFPARIGYTMGRDGVLSCELDLTDRRPEPALLLARGLDSGRSGGGVSAPGGGFGGAGTNLQPLPSNGQAGSVQYQPVASFCFLSAPAAYAGSAGAAAEVDALFRSGLDLTQYSQARLVVYVTTLGTLFKLSAKYSTDGGSTWEFLDASAGPFADATSVTAPDVVVGDWVDLDELARADVLITLFELGIMGPPPAAYNLASIHLQLR